MHADLPASEPAPGAPSGPVPADAPDGPGEAVYGARYYETYTGGSYEYEGQWAEWFGNAADRIIRQWNPRTVFDAGCAKGFLVLALRERGVEAYGIDFSEYAVANAPEAVKPYVSVGSIAEPIEGRYDLVTCIEVIEHLPTGEVPKAIDSLCAAGDRILFSSTGEGEHLGEPSHLSMLPPEGWAANFTEAGFFRNCDEDVTWLAPWAMVLERRPGMTVPEVVREYERRAARDQREIFELRRTALRLEQELEELQGRTGTTAAQRQLAALRAHEQQVADALTETLRLRDLLIVNERELGRAKGEIARLLDQMHGHGELVKAHQAVLESTTWRLGWKVMAPYRKLRTKLGG